jgi:hypothetical protein
VPASDGDGLVFDLSSRVRASRIAARATSMLGLAVYARTFS